jgi:hypothetical protein
MIYLINKFLGNGSIIENVWRMTRDNEKSCNKLTLESLIRHLNSHHLLRALLRLSKCHGRSDEEVAGFYYCLQQHNRYLKKCKKSKIWTYYLPLDFIALKASPLNKPVIQGVTQDDLLKYCESSPPQSISLAKGISDFDFKEILVIHFVQ